MTDRRLATGVAMLERLAAMLDVVSGTAAIVQIREKDLDAAALLAMTRDVVAVARPHGAAVLINDRLDVALAGGADGVHLPETGLTVADARQVAARCGRSIIVGCSRHSAAGVAEAASAGADLVVLGPIWATPSKAGVLTPLGPGALADARAAMPTAVALVAIGGIETAARAAVARQAGATGVAAIRALWAAEDPAAAARALAGA